MKLIKMTHYTFRIILGCVFIMLLTSCDDKTEMIEYGQDECAFCTMRINDNKYSGKLITSEGESYKFDSIECLTEFALVKNYYDDKDQYIMIADFNSPGNFIDARNSMFVRNDNFKSPMGLNVMAFDSKEMADNFISENGGELFNWIDIVNLVRKRSE